MRRRDFLVFTGSFVAICPDPARADDVTFLCASALRPAMEVVVARFRKATGQTISVAYANIGTITDQIRKGARADLAVTSPQQRQSLQSEGKVVADFKAEVAQVGLGVAIRPDSAPLDLSSNEGVKRVLLNARAVAFGDPSHGSPSGADTLRLFEKLGIAEQMKSKSQVVPGSAEIFQAIVERRVDFGIIHTSVIAAASPKVALASLPAELRYLTIFVASIPSTSEQPKVARAFGEFLMSREAAAVFEAHGMGLK